MLRVFDSAMVGAKPALVGGAAGEGGGRAGPRAVAHAPSAPFRRRDARSPALKDKTGAAPKPFGDRLRPRRDRPAFSLSFANRRRPKIAPALRARTRPPCVDESSMGRSPLLVDRVYDAPER